VRGGLLARLAAASAVTVGVLAGPALAAPAPYPTADGLLVDAADAIDDADEVALEESLQIYEDATGIEVAVLVIRTLDGRSVEDYARGAFAAWGVGRQDHDNGVLLLVAVKERRVHLEVAAELRHHLDGGVAGRIVDDDVLPSLRDGDVLGAVESGVVAIQDWLDQGTGGDFAPEDDSPPPGLYDGPVAGFEPVRDLDDDGGFRTAAGLVVALAALAVIGIVLGRVFGRGRSHGGSGDW